MENRTHDNVYNNAERTHVQRAHTRFSRPVSIFAQETLSRREPRGSKARLSAGIVRNPLVRYCYYRSQYYYVCQPRTFCRISTIVTVGRLRFAFSKITLVRTAVGSTHTLSKIISNYNISPQNRFQKLQPITPGRFGSKHIRSMQTSSFRGPPLCRSPRGVSYEYHDNYGFSIYTFQTVGVSSLFWKK